MSSAEAKGLLYIQVAELASLAQLLPPCSPTVRNPVPIALCAELLLTRLRRLQLLFPARLPRSASISAELPSCIHTQLLLTACVHFNCCSRLRPFQLLPDTHTHTYGCTAAAPRTAVCLGLEHLDMSYYLIGGTGGSLQSARDSDTS